MRSFPKSIHIVSKPGDPLRLPQRACVKSHMYPVSGCCRKANTKQRSIGEHIQNAITRDYITRTIIPVLSYSSRTSSNLHEPSRFSEPWYYKPFTHTHHQLVANLRRQSLRGIERTFSSPTDKSNQALNAISPYSRQMNTHKISCQYKGLRSTARLTPFSKYTILLLEHTLIAGWSKIGASTSAFSFASYRYMKETSITASSHHTRW